MWNKRHTLLLFLNSLSTGLLIPVTSLLLLSMGCTLSTLPLIMGFYCAVVIAAEVPSGIYADRRGRKRCFFLAQLFQTAFLLLLIVGQGVAAVAAAMAAMGLSRAFSSGSLDALVVDAHLAEHGEESIPACTARMSVLSNLGLATGSISGGVLYGIAGDFSLLLAAKMAVTAALLVGSLGLKEVGGRQAGKKERVTRDGLWSLLREDRAIRWLVAACVMTGVLLLPVEEFWQPRFLELQDGPAAGWLLGLIGAGSYYAAAAGTALGRRLSPRPRMRRVLLAQASGGAALVLLGCMGRWWTFLAAYFLLYMAVGWADYLSTTLMNQAVAPEHRASVLSVGSLSLQLGGVGTSVLLSVGMAAGTIAQAWVTVGVLIQIIGAAAALVLRPAASPERTGA